MCSLMRSEKRDIASGLLRTAEQIMSAYIILLRRFPVMQDIILSQ